MPSNLMRQPNFAALLILAWLAVASVLLLQNWQHGALSPAFQWDR